MQPESAKEVAEALAETQAEREAAAIAWHCSLEQYGHSTLIAAIRNRQDVIARFEERFGRRGTEYWRWAHRPAA